MSAPGDPTEHVRGVIGRAPSVFAHFFDIHFLKEKGIVSAGPRAGAEARLAVRFALLLADEVLIPAASYYESELCRSVLKEYEPQLFFDRIFLVGSGASIEEFSEEKLAQYLREQEQWRAYSEYSSLPLFPWRTRRGSATKDIAQEWIKRVEADGLDFLRRSIRDNIPKDIERRLLETPERLGPRAFIIPNLIPILFDSDTVSHTAENGLHSVVNRAYFGSYIKELGSSVIQNLSFLASPEPIPSGDPAHDINFGALSRACREQGVMGEILHASPENLMALRSDPRFVAAASLAGGPEPLVDARIQFFAVRRNYPRWTIVMLLASPAGHDPIEVSMEARDVRNELRSALDSDAFELKIYPAATAACLTAALNDDKPDIVHFSGHGGAGAILLDNATIDDLGGQPVKASLLKRILKTAPRRPRLLLLNACESAADANQLTEAVDVIIAMTAEVADSTAYNYSRRFYAALFAGLSIKQADEQARAVISIDDPDGSKLPILISADGIDADTVKFS